MKNDTIARTFQEVLEEQEAFLFEKWSHYDDIDEAIEYIYDKVAEAVRNLPDKPVIVGKIYLRGGHTNIHVFGKDMQLVFLMYIATDESHADYMVKHCYAQNGITKDEKTMYITLYTINGSLLEPMCNKSVAHELKHVLQMSKGQSANIDYGTLGDLAYERSNNVLDNPDSFSEADVKVAWLYYYSNPHEQDAFMEEYYKDLCTNRQSLFDKDSETHRRLDFFNTLAHWYNANTENPEVKTAVAQYRVHGMPKRNFEAMVIKAYKRFDRKMANIEKHFKEKSEYLKEHYHHGGPKTVTGSLRVFNLLI